MRSEYVTDGFHFLAWTAHRMGDLAVAEPLYRRALELHGAALPADHPYRVAAHVRLGELLLELGRASEAQPHLSEAVAIGTGRTAWETEDLDRARAAFERAKASAATDAVPEHGARITAVRKS